MVTYLSGNRIQGTSTGASLDASFESDFTSASGWEQNTSGTTNIAVTTGSDRVNYDTTSSGSGVSTLVYDLGTSNISETAWVLRGKSVLTNYNAGDSSSCHMFCGLSDLGKTVAFDANQDSISFAIGVGTNDDNYYIGAGNGGAMYTLSSHNNGNTAHEPTEETLYFELIRTSTTGVTLNLYTDSSFTTSPTGYTKSVVLGSVPTGLRYLVFKTRDRSISGNECQGYIQDLQFYNGVTSTTQSEKVAILANAPTGTRYEETDTRKIFRRKEALPISTTGLKAYYRFNETGADGAIVEIVNHATVANGCADGLGTGANMDITEANPTGAGHTFNNTGSPSGLGNSIKWQREDNTLADNGTEANNGSRATAGNASSEWKFLHYNSANTGNQPVWTICFWAKFTGIENNNMLLSTSANSELNNGISIKHVLDGSRGVRFNIYRSVGNNHVLGSGSGSSPHWTGQSVDNSWDFYSITFDGATGTSNAFKIKMNNTGLYQVNRTSHAPDSGNPEHSLHLGSAQPDWDTYIMRHYNIADLSIWNRLLTDAEITTLYASGNGKVLTVEEQSWAEKGTA